MGNATGQFDNSLRQYHLIHEEDRLSKHPIDDVAHAGDFDDLDSKRQANIAVAYQL